MRPGLRLTNVSSASTTLPPATAAYYHAIFTYIKSKSTTHDDIVGNPGTAALTDWQLNDIAGTQAADEIVIFEGPMTGKDSLELFVMPVWARNYPASDIVMLVYDVPEASIASVCARLKSDRVGLVEVTDATIIPGVSTPWNSLQSASYWTAFRAACR